MSLSASNGPSGPSLPRALDRARGLLACLGAYLAAGALAAAMGRLALGLHPILTAALADLAATLVVFLFSLAYNNSSIYDPYWSLIPPFLALFWLLWLPFRRARESADKTPAAAVDTRRPRTR